MENKYSVVMTTVSAQKEADEITNILLNNRLASCVQQSNISSSYHWNGKIERSSEILLMIKTRSDLVAEIEAFIKTNCSYENPEIIALPITDGSSNYLSWINNETK